MLTGAASMALGILTFPANAQTQLPDGFCATPASSSNVNIRSQPSTNSQILGTLESGRGIETRWNAKEKGWIKIDDYEGRGEAWVSDDVANIVKCIELYEVTPAIDGVQLPIQFVNELAILGEIPHEFTPETVYNLYKTLETNIPGQPGLEPSDCIKGIPRRMVIFTDISTLHGLVSNFGKQYASAATIVRFDGQKVYPLTACETTSDIWSAAIINLDIIPLSEFGTSTRGRDNGNFDRIIAEYIGHEISHLFGTKDIRDQVLSSAYFIGTTTVRAYTGQCEGSPEINFCLDLQGVFEGSSGSVELNESEIRNQINHIRELVFNRIQERFPKAFANIALRVTAEYIHNPPEL
jgi:hypothetical protein